MCNVQTFVSCDCDADHWSMITLKAYCSAGRTAWRPDSSTRGTRDRRSTGCAPELIGAVASQSYCGLTTSRPAPVSRPSLFYASWVYAILFFFQWLVLGTASESYFYVSILVIIECNYLNKLCQLHYIRHIDASYTWTVHLERSHVAALWTSLNSNEWLFSIEEREV